MSVDVEIVPLGLSNIGKHYGRSVVLQDVNLTVSSGEVVGLLGSNGAGKTTLLSIASGLLQPDRGKRLFAGRPELGIRERGRLAYVSHGAQLYPLLTAGENLDLYVQLRRAAGHGSEPWQPLLERLGLGEVVERRVATFSRGMMQRLVLVRALLGRPQLLLLDEPFTALDRNGRMLLATVLRDAAAAGMAILLSSHDLDAVLSATDRAVLLEHGRIVGATERTTGAGVEDLDGYRGRVLALGHG